MQHDIEGAVRGYYPEDLDSAYPGVRDRLLSELSTLRRKAEALDWLDDNEEFDLVIGKLGGRTLLSAIEQAKEAGRETPA